MMLNKATKPFEILFFIYTLSSHLLPSSALQMPLLDPKPIREILPSPVTATERSAPNTDNCFCRGGGQLTWPIGINTQVINLSTMIYCQSNSSLDFNKGKRPNNSTMAEDEIARVKSYWGGWIGVGIGTEATWGEAYVIFQDWIFEGLAEVKRNGTLCGVYLGVDDEGP